jgi:hypothetical protein
MERDLSEATAERLLSGDLTSPPDGAERLAAVLAAASAPGRPDELAGEAAAMAAFRARPATVRRWSLRHALTVKATAAIVAATVAAGGVALASGTGLLPIPFVPDKPEPVPSVTEAPAARTPAPKRTPSPAQTPPPAPPAPNDTLPGLCAEYQKKTNAEKQKELKTKRFEELVREAGGADRVEAFCVQVLAATPQPGKGNGGNNNQGNAAPSGPPGAAAGSGAPGHGPAPANGGTPAHVN